MNKTNREYTSCKITLKDIVEEGVFFNIPIYQRLYVWKQSQINTLLEDIYAAYKAGESKYFLGGVMTVRNGHRFDLVDGQQRFTTLWLICNVTKQVLVDKTPTTMVDFCEKDRKKRISFSIRPFISDLIDKLQISNLDSQQFDDVPDLKNMVSAIGDIRAFVEDGERQKDLKGFAGFIVENVILVKTEIPANADLNKIFELINGRGQQLSQTDILKSKLLNLVRDEINSNDDMLVRYGQVWDSCADMSGYIEANIYSQDSNLTWKDLLGDIRYRKMGKEFLDYYVNLGLNTNLEYSDIATDLASLIDSSSIELQDERGYKNVQEESVRSIVSFPMLLLYTLRIFLIKNNLNLYKCNRMDIDVFNEKKLLHIFKPFVEWLKSNKGKTRGFIELLWLVRVAFDNYVVKFAKTEDSSELVLTLKSIRVNEGKSFSVSRDNQGSITDMTQLQSMLYFSQPRIYEHWICPFIVMSLEESDSKKQLVYLQQLDNNLSCLQYDEDMIVRTYDVMKNGLHIKKVGDYIDYFEGRIDENLGCKFAHYLFYKMDYMLWCEKTKERNERWSKFRITSKNSVEHISPQTPRFEEERIADCDSFGNLALISNNDNASYNNKSYAEKLAAYKNKRDHGYIDSLKSDMIYHNYSSWGKREHNTHLEDMRAVAKDYFVHICDNYNTIMSSENQFRKWVEYHYLNNKTKLLQAVFTEDPIPNCWSLPILNDLKEMEEVKRVFRNNQSLNPIEKNISEFQFVINYYFCKYPQAIEACSCDRYKVKGFNKIILLDGVRERQHNYQELLMMITSSFLEIENYVLGRYTGEGCDFRGISLYLHNNIISHHIDKNDEYEDLSLNIWCDYDRCQMNYQIDYRQLMHPNKFSKIMEEYGWRKYDKGKFMYIDGKPYLHSFKSNDDYERIAQITVKEVKKIIKKLREVSFH